MNKKFNLARVPGSDAESIRSSSDLSTWMG